MSKKILYVYDSPEPFDGISSLELLKTETYSEDLKVFKTLQKLGHSVTPFALFDNLGELFEELQNNQHDLVFHQAESFKGSRAHESHLAAFYKLSGINHTGASAEVLALCSDKALTKKILAHHHIKAPLFETFLEVPHEDKLSLLPYPGIVKPLNLEGSEGISQSSFVNTPKEAAARIKWIHEKLGVGAIFEEYIEGRELYVSLIGRQRFLTLPIREHFFGDVDENAPKIATYNAKWNDEYRKKWGIKSGFAKQLSPAQSSKIQSTAKRIARILGINSYARIDFRMKADGSLYFIEANPNPSIYADDELAMASIKFGMSYADFLQKIIDEAT